MKRLGQAFSFWSIVREVNLNEVREDSEKEPVIVLAAKSEEAAAAITSALTGGLQATPMQPGPFRLISSPPSPQDVEIIKWADAIFYYLEAAPKVAEVELEEIHRIVSGPTPIIVLVSEDTALEGIQLLPNCVFARVVRISSLTPDGLLDPVVPALVESLQAEGLHLARRMPPLRNAVGTLLVSKTAKANAEFAILTNLPAFIPIVGNIVGATADFFVLTKNQIMMLYKLAAIYGRDIHSPTKVYAEVLPVVGAGLLWRTIAREISALVPVWAGAVPKVFIAYAGTVAVGLAAAIYYGEGYKPSREKMRELYQVGIDRARNLRLPQGTRSEEITG